ncbi:transposase [Streptomyces nigrescens]|uniref:transposase n=1 Tax=Streptomyces nigrescens TaxID=1920 RepID=UPI00361121DA
MTDAEWAGVRVLLPVLAWLEGRGGRPEGYCYRQMFDAVRYVVDSGVKCARWLAWDRVYAFFQRWRR